MKNGSIYSASDKALFDALTQNAVTNADLRQLFLRHGIVISKQTSRKNLAKYFSRLVHDYDDFQLLAKLFDTGQRKERTSCFRVQSGATLSDFENAAHRLVATMISEGHSAQLKVLDTGAIQIDVTYKKFHFDKNEFKQLATRHAILTIENEDGEIVVAGPQNSDVDNWSRILISEVSDAIDGTLDISEISLDGISDVAIRTKFFLNLITLMPGLRMVDVSDVYLHKPKEFSAGIDEFESEANVVELDNDQVQSNGFEDVKLDVHISRAALRGQGVLESSQIQELLKQDFYIARIVWLAKPNIFDADLYEFEAQFAEPESCTRFSFLTKGFYAYKGDGEHSITRTQFPRQEDRRLSRLIEAAARKSLLTL